MASLKIFLTENPGWVYYLFGFTLLQIGIAIEAIISVLTHRKVYNLKDSLTNFSMYLGYFTILLFWTPVVFGINYFIHGFALFDLGSYWLDPTSFQFWWQWSLLLVLDDLCYYLFHLSSHNFQCPSQKYL